MPGRDLPDSSGDNSATTAGTSLRRYDNECDTGPVRVSYVIGTKNRASYLRNTLNNLKAFVDECDEVIIIDGGSNDETPDIVDDFKKLVNIFVSEPDTSESHAFNKAVSLARGRYIKAIPDDDYFYPEAMRRLIAVAEETPDWDAIQTGGEVWNVKEGDKPVFCEYVRLYHRRPSPLDIFAHRSGVGLLFRRRTLIRIGGCSPGYKLADDDLHCKLIESGCRVRYLDINLFRWHRYPHSGSTDVTGITRDKIMLNIRLRLWPQALHHLGVLSRIDPSHRRLSNRVRRLLALALAVGEDALPVAIGKFARRVLLGRREAPQVTAPATSEASFTGELY